jgi:hypothetical protein
MVLLLLVAALLGPLSSTAHDSTSGAAEQSCTCDLLPSDCGDDTNNNWPDHCPGSNSDDHCDGEGCSPDATEPPNYYDLRVTIFLQQHFHTYTNGHIPEVYFAIFVPPQSCFNTCC